MILHQFLLLFAQIDQFLQTIIVMIIHKLPINITIHSIITFILHQIQILMQISTKININLIRIQQHKTLSYNYHNPVLHRIIYILKIKELRILQLLIPIPHNILKEDFKTLHLQIYQLILCIKCIQILIQILIEIQIHYHKIRLNIYLLNSHSTWPLHFSTYQCYKIPLCPLQYQNL